MATEVQQTPVGCITTTPETPLLIWRGFCELPKCKHGLVVFTAMCAVHCGKHRETVSQLYNAEQGQLCSHALSDQLTGH